MAVLDQDGRARARRTWELGDYPAVAARLVQGAQAVAAAAGPGQGRAALDVAARLVQGAQAVAAAAGPGQGRAALDVAAGTGSLALALAESGWEASAVDIAPRLIEAGRCRARAAGQHIRWHEASLDDLPFEAGSFDLVASSFGLIFAADPVDALAEAHRVLRPGGRLAFSAWTPEGFIGRMSSVMGQVLSAEEMMTGPFRWGDPFLTSEWLADGFTRVRTQVHNLPWVFPSAQEATDFMFAHSPGHLASMELAGPRGDELIAAVTELTQRLASPDGSIDIAAHYVVTTAQRAI